MLNRGVEYTPIKEYSREFQRKLAGEVEKANVNAVWPLALKDYALVRQQLYQCFDN